MRPIGLHFQLREWCEAKGAARAITFLVDGEQQEDTLTYEQLYTAATKVAAGLANFQGKTALLLLPPGNDYVVALLACFYAGVIAVPAYPPLSRRMLPRVEGIMKDCEAAAVVTTAEVKRLMTSEQEKGASEALQAQWIELGELKKNPAAVEWERASAGAKAAFLQYTSGSTSQPKGVVVTHDNIMANSETMCRRMGYNEETVFVSWLPPYHDMGLIGYILQSLYLGRPLIHLSPARFAEKPIRWLKAIEKYRATASGSPNFGYDLCVEKIGESERTGLKLDSWRRAMVGAEPVRYETLERFVTAFSGHGFSRETFLPGYGLAEATLAVAGFPYRGAIAVCPTALSEGRLEPASEISGAKVRLVSSGPPCDGFEVVVVDPVHQTPVMEGVIGEIWLRGASVSPGYWRESAALRRVSRGMATDGREYLRTGDLGALHSGELIVTGRIKELLIVNGRKFSPTDIETTVQECSRSLRPNSGAVFTVPRPMGEQVVAVQEVQPRTKRVDPTLAATIRQAVFERHELMLDKVVLVRAGSVPRTSSGKLQRVLCRERFLEGKLPELEVTQKEYVAPRDEVEQKLAGIFQEVLGLNRVGIEDNFFERGGNSLKAIRAAALARKELGMELPLTELFSQPTVKGLAETMQSRGRRKHEPIPIAPKADFYPVTSAQKRLYALQELDGGIAYNLTGAYVLEGKLDVGRMEAAMRAVINRHEALRTHFELAGGEVVQRIEETVGFKAEYTEDEQADGRELMKEFVRPFDLNLAPLLRMKVVKRALEEHLLCVDLHHIVADLVSVEVLVRDFTQAYRGEELEPLGLQYKDYAVWQQERLAGEYRKQQETYWLQRFAGEVPVLNLPTDYPRPAVQSFEGARVIHRLAENLNTKLEEFCRDQGVTRYVLLLAVFQVLLAKYSGQEDVVVGTSVAGRDHPDLTGIMGMFVNALALRNAPAGEKRFSNYLQEVKQGVLEGLEHQTYPFEDLAAKVESVRDRSRNPVFDALFLLGDAEYRRLAVGNLAVKPVDFDIAIARFDLTLRIEADAGVHLCSFEYRTGLFNVETIERMGRHYEQLIREVIDAPWKRIDEIDLLNADERRELVQEFSHEE
jgi:acyl-CoA synthetase (AMP-forming)/AMP-acid ligase II/acyl carrier protein